MFNKILVVCVGNICRSPTAEFMLKARLPEKEIASAGLHAMVNSEGVGQDMDKQARSIAEDRGVPCDIHQAQKLTRELIKEYDVVLVMESRHRDEIANRYPEALAKTFLLGQWARGNKEIPDPYRKSDEVFEQIFQLIDNACESWASKLK
ncbi:low molecular weight protein-tyrosine-phosphatase [Aliidiomarina sp. Khilg15.8]